VVIKNPITLLFLATFPPLAFINHGLLIITSMFSLGSEAERKQKQYRQESGQGINSSLTIPRSITERSISR